jgi:hypothetical protein
VEVEHDYCWAGALEQWPELTLLDGGSDQLEIWLRREDRLQADADRRVIVEQGDASHRLHSGLASAENERRQRRR